jgi:multiple sugar transport system permease protein
MTEGGNPPVAKQDHADIQDVSRAVGRRGRWKWPRQATGYLMIAPAIIFLMLVIVYPLFEVFRLSFFEFTGLRDQQSTFVGLKNFVSLMGDRIYWISMKNTLVFVLATVVFHALIGLLFALALHQHWPSNRLRNLVRGLLILPWLFSMAAAGLVWALLLNPLGPINYLLVTAGILERAMDFLGDKDTALWGLIVINVWKSYPFYMIMLLGGLQTIPPDLYAAAKVDGAGRWQRFAFVTLPMMRTILVATTAIDFITTFGVFDLVRTLTNGGPARSTITLGYYTWLVGFRDVDFGYGAAISVSMLIIMGVAMYFYLRLGREMVYG